MLPLEDSLYTAFRMSGLGRHGWKYEEAVKHPALGKCLRNWANVITRRRGLTCLK